MVPGAVRDGAAVVGAGVAVGAGADGVGAAAAGDSAGGTRDGVGVDGGRSGLGLRIGTTRGSGTIRRNIFIRTRRARSLVVSLWSLASTGEEGCR